MSELQDAIWAGDIDRLDELAPCQCCCADHTFGDCPARQWNGCRGGTHDPTAERIAWQKHYADRHGMSEAQFYGWEDE